MLTTLILRSDLKITYLGIIGIIETSGQLQKRLLVKRRPNFSTLKYIADRSQMLKIIEIMLTNIIQKFAPAAVEAALDWKGMETSSISAFYRSRSGKSRKKIFETFVVHPGRKHVFRWISSQLGAV